MQGLITSILPFPNIYWWLTATSSDVIYFDGEEHFEKMSYRNRYYIAGANGLITLTIPLVGGREQRKPMKAILIDNKDKWQIQHWRTLVSVYKRTPYFEHYEPTLQDLYDQEFDKLVDFNLASIHWLKAQLKAVFSEHAVADYQKEYPGTTDIRRLLKPGIERKIAAPPVYYQMFADRNGFAPNLSMLDLLFTEGPFAMQWLLSNRLVVEKWQRSN